MNWPYLLLGICAAAILGFPIYLWIDGHRSSRTSALRAANRDPGKGARR